MANTKPLTDIEEFILSGVILDEEDFPDEETVTDVELKELLNQKLHIRSIKLEE